MTSRQEEQGFFWLPDKPEEKIEGVISINSEQGTVLTIYGEFDPLNPEPRKKQAIHGVLAQEHIKLVNCLNTGTRMNTQKFTEENEETWRCQFAFRGDEYEGNVPNKIKSLEANIELLGEWVKGFKKIQSDTGKIVTLVVPRPARPNCKVEPWHRRRTPRHKMFPEFLTAGNRKRNGKSTHVIPHKLRRAAAMENGTKNHDRPAGTGKYSQRRGNPSGEIVSSRRRRP